MTLPVLSISFDELETILGKIQFALTDRGICFLSWRQTGWQDFYLSLEGEFIPEVETGNEAAKDFAAELGSYLNGDIKVFTCDTDLINVSTFQKKILETTRSIPFGQVRSYGELAMEAGFPNAYRAVGSTMKMNPIPIVIPCHRVVKSDGFIGDFGGRPDLKKILLEMEGVTVDNNYRYE